MALLRTEIKTLKKQLKSSQTDLLKDDSPSYGGQDREKIMLREQIKSLNDEVEELT